jgi:hypothetical protein
MSCKLFLHNPMLLMSPYHVSSSVSADVFPLFVRAIEGHDPDPALTHENCPALNLLCDEFEFTCPGSKVEVFTDRWTSLVFGAERGHIERDKPVRTCSKFRDCRTF